MDNIIQLFKKNFSWNIFFTVLYVFLILGFFYNENSTGGAFADYLNQKKISQDFAINFKNSFLNFDQYFTRHSPILIMFLSVFEKSNLDDHLIRFIHLHLCLLLPIIFFLTLKIKYNFIKPENLLLLIGLIFLSPTFRSLAIWPDSRLVGLILFCYSIYYYLKFDENKKFKNCVLNIFFCAMSAYVSPNFAVFSIFYFYKFFIFYKFKKNKLATIILLNLVLSIPAFYYLFVLDINFLNKTAAVTVDQNVDDKYQHIFFVNIYNKVLIISSIILFYLLPFLITKIISINKIFKLDKILISLAIFLISIFYFDYDYQFTGGGIFFKFSNLFFNNNILFFIISFFSILIIINLSNAKFENILLLILILLNNPQVTIYHKYYDPLLLIIFFTLFNFNLNLSEVGKKINFSIIYLFFISFLLISNFKYLWNI